MLKIGTQPVLCDGKEATTAIINGLTKSAGRPIDPSSLKITVKHADGKSTELKDGDSLELSATVAAAKPAKPAKKDKPGTAAPKPGTAPKSPFPDSKQS